MRTFALRCTLLLLSLSIASGQIVTGSIAGTITDSSGAVVAGADVTLLRPDTGMVRTTTGDEGGNFQFGGLEPGEYNVRAGKRGDLGDRSAVQHPGQSPTADWLLQHASSAEHRA